MFDANPNNVYGGYVYNNPQMNQQYQPKQQTNLTNEEFERLRKHESAFSLQLTETEKLRGICNHRRLDGLGDTLVSNGDGSVMCTTCGYVFNLADGIDNNDVQRATNTVVDILQSIKLLYIDMPVEAQREYYQIIPLVEKIPKLYDMATKDFMKHEGAGGWNFRNNNMGTLNLFNMLSGAPNMGYGAQPNYGYQQMPNQQGAWGPQYQQAYGYQQPNYGYQQMPNQQVPQGTPVGAVPPQSNGFGYAGTAPMMGAPGYQPATNGYQYTPGVNPQPVTTTPQADAPQPGVQQATEQTTSTDGKTVTTQATFKS